MIFLLSIIVLLQFCARLCAWQNRIAVWVAGAVLGSSVWLFLPYAWENSRMELERKVSTGIWADNLTLLVSLDVLLGVYLVWLLFRKENSLPVKRAWMLYLPSLLLFPSVFWLGAEVFYSLPGLTYTQTGIALTCIFILGLPLFSFFLKWAFVYNMAIAEFQGLLNIALLAAMVVQPLLSATQPSYREPVQWPALAVIVAVCVVGFLSGIVINKIIKKFQYK
jgi:hypothetical protein